MQVSTKRFGFTFIELLVAIATISVLSSILLPGIYNARRSVNVTRAGSTIRRVCLAIEELAAESNQEKFAFLQSLDLNAFLTSEEFREIRERYLSYASNQFIQLEDGGIGYQIRTTPDGKLYHCYDVLYLTDRQDIENELKQLARYRGAGIQDFAKQRLSFEEPPPLLIFDAQFRAYGYRIYCDLIDCQTLELVTEPEIFSFRVSSKPLDRTALATILATVEILNADEDPEETARQLKPFVRDPDVIGFVASGFDLNEDNLISVAEFSSVCRARASRDLGPEPTVVELVDQQFFQLVVDELRLNPADDEIQEGVRIDDLTGDPAEVLSFNSACWVTGYLAEKSQVSESLCEKLDRAEEAEREGSLEVRDSILLNAQEQVQSLSGISFSPEDADRLDLIYEIQKSEPR